MPESNYKFWSPLNDSFGVPDSKSRCSWHLGIDANLNPHTEQTTRPKNNLLSDVLAAIGDTPLIKLNKIPQSEGLKCEVYVKCEFFNPAGSVKDRIALRMIEDAEKQGLLKPGDTIIEPTSGNTGIALALVGAIKGYKVIVVMPEKMSNEKVIVQAALGARIVRVPNDAPVYSSRGMMGVAHKLKTEIANSIILDQFANPGNSVAHYDTTAQEIFDDCDGKVDMIVVTAGTGGTITGIGRKFKEISPHTKIVGVDPVGSVLAQPESLNDVTLPFFEVEGIGYKFVASVLDRSVVDQWIKTTDDETMLMARRLIKEEGLLCGGSSGAAIVAAFKAGKCLGSDQRLVVILSDGIRNYLTKFVTDQWMEARGFLPCINENKHWWWNKNVLELNLQKPAPISMNTSLEKAFSSMKQFGVEQLPIEETTGIVSGVLTLQNLMNGLNARKLKPSEEVAKCNIIQIFPQIDNKLGNLGLVSRILEKEPYVVVLEKVDNSEENKFVGIVTPMILLEYTLNTEL